MNQDNLLDLLATSRTIRGHTCHALKHQTVGHHTYRTLVILHWLYAPELPPQKMSYAMLIHDMPEVHTGDMPGDTKATSPEMGALLQQMENRYYQSVGIYVDLNTHEQLIIDICDRADLFFWGTEEVGMGNILFSPVMNKAKQMFTVLYQKYLNASVVPVLPRMSILREYIK